MTSVGFTVREDRDTAAALPVLERFQHYVDRYPAVKWIMSHYDLVENPYEKRQPYGAFLKLAHDSEQVAGPGWCAIGDAAQFSHPHFLTWFELRHRHSLYGDEGHGQGFGQRRPFTAGFCRVPGLCPEHLPGAAAADRYAVPVVQTCGSATERAFALVFFFGAQDALPRTAYSDTDPFVFDLLNPASI